MSYAAGTTVKFDFEGHEQRGDDWFPVRRTGTATVKEYGFNMQLGETGYRLEVVDSNDYERGTEISVYRHNVRA